MQELINIKGTVPAVHGMFENETDNLIASTGGFPVLSIRGGKWRVKVSGDEQPLVDAATGDTIPSLELVIVAVSKYITKNYYIEDYAEGDTEEPDCYSEDGEFPAADAAKPQCASCAACPQNVWGSKITPAGKKSKNCADSKRLAVTFASDLYNEALGGLMLLRVPAASLKDMTIYGRGMKAKGYVPQQVVTRFGFDAEASYPKLTFKAVRPVSADDLAIIEELYNEPVASEITCNPPPAVAAAQKQQVKSSAVDTEFEEVTVQTTAPAAAPTTAPATAPAAAPATAPTTAPKKRRKRRTKAEIEADKAAEAAKVAAETAARLAETAATVAQQEQVSASEAPVAAAAPMPASEGSIDDAINDILGELESMD